MADAAGGAENLLETRPDFSWDDIKEAAGRFGSFEFVKMLASERDQNFLLRSTDEAGMIVFKVHNPTDEVAFVECQTQALELAGSGGASVQKILRTSDTKESIIQLPLKSGKGTAQCRALSFLPGRMLADVAVDPTTDRAALCEKVGRAVGSVTKTLLDFQHASAHREFHWDLAKCEEVISAKVADVVEERRPMIDAFMARYRQSVKPLLPSCRKSIVHNDPNDYNLVVLEDGSVGVLDFGDMLHSYTVADAAIGLAYLMFACPEDKSMADEIVLPFARGFHGSCPLTPAEGEALLGLAIMRVCTSVCMSSYQSRLEPDNEYLLISAKPGWALLGRLSSGDDEKVIPGLVKALCEA
eukprot:TRINITY_DN65644_c0_g1_i1.p1 TRINITY_DN65644_c0_g1~~TRINITY_DN65644_c0_g1_i1.p1  ORF type:complete len:356 (-),score=92.40 TRINITY_DN65644_c0_g1_i1:175-1242(-)